MIGQTEQERKITARQGLRGSKLTGVSHKVPQMNSESFIAF